MSAEELIGYIYGGCNSNDMDDAADGVSGEEAWMYLGGADSYGGMSRSEPSTRYRKSIRSQTNNKEKVMENRVSALIAKKVVAVKFVGQTNNDKEYSYFTDIMDIEVSDLVVVATQYGFKTAIVQKVQALSKTARSAASKWIVCRVDLEEFRQKLEKYELVQEIEIELEEEMAAFNRIQFYQAAAQANPRIAELINKLTDLTGVKELTDESKA